MQSKTKNILDERMSTKIESVIPKNRQDVLKWYGWGYNDSKFFVKDNIICFKGERYPLANCLLPRFTDWVYRKFDHRVYDDLKFPEMPASFPKAKLNPSFMEVFKQHQIEYSVKGEDRLIRSHGQTLHDIYSLWKNDYKRIPDLVTWPTCHDEVVIIINLADKYNVVVIPFGGGTSVSGSISCPEEERMIIALDTSQMNKMLWLDKENLTVCFESGIVGQDLERELRKFGLTVGHEPDSYEFSTLGGWVATRASGMKKNVYGNIEDLLVKVKMVTTKGVLERECSAPRISCGPDLNHIVMGSEGTLGVITEVVLKVRPLPLTKRYGSLVFPNFEDGVKFMREVAKRRCQPASIRLMDNEQFRFGQSLKPSGTRIGEFLEAIKQLYATKIKGLDLNKICAATLLFEGEEEDVRRQESIIYEIAKEHNGFPAGGQNGERGYILTFVIAYIRDFALNNEIVAESFETSVPWDRCNTLCRNVKQRVADECKRYNIKKFLISCRVTQTYDAGACVYFYFAFKYTNVCSDPVHTYELIENFARDEILASGGSLSHHHGVGKIRAKWYPQTVSDTGIGIYKAIKFELDPKNIFAAGNLIPINKNDMEKGKKEIMDLPKAKL